MAIDPELRKQFETMGADVARSMLGEWTGWVKQQAIEWLGQHDKDEREREETSRADELAFAREANEIARAANDLAASANTIALAASASAERSAVAAITNNRIAKAAFIAAIIAIAISIVALFMK
jgi:hypothetical protein